MAAARGIARASKEVQVSMTMLRTIAAVILSVLALTGCSSTPRDMLMERGEVAYEAGQYNVAADNFQQVVDRYGGDWQANYYLGKTRLALDEPNAAQIALAVAHTRKPNNVEVADSLAEALFRQGREEQLFEFLRERATTQQTVHAYLRWAMYSLEMGDPDSAKLAVDTAIRIDRGRSVAPYLAAADLAERVGDRRTALLRLRQAYTVDPDDELVKDRLLAMGEIPGPTLAAPLGR